MEETKILKKVEPIQIKKLKIRGDEIAILFFSLLFLIFLGVSFFRLFAIGKLFDDFIFVLLFGWSKYLVYLTLFSLTIPICFNYYFKFKFSFILAITTGLIAISWLVGNINLIFTNEEKIWLTNPYSFDIYQEYLNNWWSSTIINNYHGFFGQPISFSDWTNVNSFFPSFAAGGVISNFLIVITNYGGFITSFILNILLLMISFTWIVFNKPWFLFTVIFFFITPIINYVKKQRIQKINQRSRQQEQMAVKKNKPQTENNNQQAENFSEIKATKETVVKVKEVKPEAPIKVKPDKQQLLMQNVLKESGNLTPFGQVKRDVTQSIDVVSEQLDETINQS